LPETNDLGQAVDWLEAGENVLAIQVHNDTVGDATLRCDAGLRMRGGPVLVPWGTNWRYYVGIDEPSGGVVDNNATNGLDSGFLDWLELVNEGATNVSLAGWSLTDDEDEPGKWVFPAVEMAAGEYLVVFCSGNDVRDAGRKRFHMSFELDRGGEYLALHDASGTAVSQFAPEYPRQDCFYSYGWDTGAGRHRYFRTATPGGANAGDGFDELPSPPELEPPSGLYSSNVWLRATAAPPAARIYYTEDGTTPTPLNGTLLTAGAELDHTAAVTARAFNDEGVGSRAVSRIYLIREPEVITSRPVVSIVGDPERTLFKPHGVTAIVGGEYVGGLWRGAGPDDYNNVQYRGRAYEREGALAVIHSTNLVTEGSCGIRMAGSNYMRPRYMLRYLDGLWNGNVKDYRPMFNITFRNLYGRDHLNGQVIPLSPKRDLCTMRLRGGHNDSINPFLRDELARRLLHDAGRVCAVGMMASLYVNGEFKGYYNPCERYSTEFFQRRYDSNRDWDVITHGTGGYRVNEGTGDAWLDLYAFARSTDCSILANYQELTRKMAPAACIDYWLVNIYAGTWDWGGNNWTASSERASQGRFRYHVWDAEGAFRGSRLNHNSIASELLNKGTYMSRIFTGAYASDEFKRLFKDRVWMLLHDEQGALTDANIQRRFDELADALDPLMNHVRGHAVTRGEIQGFIDGRRPIVLQQLKDAGLHDDFVAPTISPAGGEVTNGTLVTIAGPPGKLVYYAFDGADPRAPGGGIAGELYEGPIAIDRSRHITARAIDRFGRWGPPAEGSFVASLPPIVVSEIMYHPADPADGPYSDDDFEFIELLNVGTEPMVLTGYRFVSGIDFDFGLGDVEELEPGEYVLVVANREAFAARYETDGLPIAGEFSGQLSNGGEALELHHYGFGRVIRFAYKDGWYGHTDGGGFSLTLRHPLAAEVPDSKESWRASSLAGGSPGKADENLVPEPGTIVINEVLAHTDASPVGDWIELHNRSSEPVYIGRWTLSDDAADLLKYTIPHRTMLSGHGHLVLSASNHFAHPSAGKPFALSEHGETLCLASATGSGGVMTGYRYEVVLPASEREVTMGIYERRDGKLEWTTLTAATWGADNAPPRVGPVVISEIMYNAASNAIEFVELYNISVEPVDLFDPEHPSNTWRLAGGIDYSFPSSVTLPAHTSLVVCATNPAAFRLAYGLAASVGVYGPFAGALDNAGDDVRLYKPGEPDADGLPWIPVDRVDYDDRAPWPVEADGTGRSLHRIVPAAYGNDPFNWEAGATNGSPATDVDVDSDGDGIPDAWEAAHALDPASAADAAFDLDGDGRSAVEEYVLGTDPRSRASCFELAIDSRPPQGAVIRFRAAGATGPGYTRCSRFYALEMTDDLVRVPFAPLSGYGRITGRDQWVAATNTVHDRRVFYRGRVWLGRE